jgi:hypothetical protein
MASGCRGSASAGGCSAGAGGVRPLAGKAKVAKLGRADRVRLLGEERYAPRRGNSENKRGPEAPALVRHHVG